MRVSKEPEIRRQEIIETARVLFEAQGPARTSITDIAERAGIAKGLIYYYFASKETLLAAVVEQIAAGVDQELAECVASPDRDFCAKLAAILSVFFSAIRRNPNLLGTMPGEPAARGLAFDHMLASAERHGAAVLEQGMQLGLVRLAYPEEMVKILVRGLGGLYLEGCIDPLVHATIVEQVLGLTPGSLHAPAGLEPS